MHRYYNRNGKDGIDEGKFIFYMLSLRLHVPSLHPRPHIPIVSPSSQLV